MPEMDGLQFLGHVRAVKPKLPIIVFSSLTERAAEMTLKALAAGASDYAPKPSGTCNATEAVRVIRESLLPR